MVRPYHSPMRFTLGLLAALVLVAAGCQHPVFGHGDASSGGHWAAVHPPRPHIVQRPIPFSATRRAETAAYAKRHYGIDTWRSAGRRVIVEHYTAGTTFASAYATFAADVPDSELHELPGTCAHFVIDTDGTIYQLVRLDTICRHTVGLNYTAIGIEHVGTSDGEILGNAAQLRRIAAAHRLAPVALRDQAQERDRAQREPHEPVSPRALRVVAVPDARRLDGGRHEHLPRAACGSSTAATASRSGRPPGPSQAAADVAAGPGRGTRPPIAADTITTAPTAIRTSPTE